MMRSSLLRLAMALSLAMSAGAANASARYFMVMFAAEDAGNNARASHTWATFVSVQDGALVEEHTISWMPAPGYLSDGNKMPRLATVPGRNYSLDETLAMSRVRKIYWGPYEIAPDLFHKAKARVRFLERPGAASYKMFVKSRSLREPALNMQPGGVINCIMAVSDLGGYFDTGLSWGQEASIKTLGLLSRWIRNYPTNTHADVGRLLRLPQRAQRGGF